jgi:hypothetical protein
MKEVARLAHITEEEYDAYKRSLETKRNVVNSHVQKTLNAINDHLYGMRSNHDGQTFKAFKKIHASLFQKDRMLAIVKTACSKATMLKSMHL